MTMGIFVLRPYSQRSSAGLDSLGESAVGARAGAGQRDTEEGPGYDPCPPKSVNPGPPPGGPIVLEVTKVPTEYPSLLGNWMAKVPH